MKLKKVDRIPTNGSFIAVWATKVGTLETAAYYRSGGELYCHDATLAKEQPADLFYEYFITNLPGVLQFF